MDLSNFKYDLITKPAISVSDTSENSYSDAILKTRSAIMERMHYIIDYYCEQISLLDRFAANSAGKSPDEFWPGLMNYANIDFKNLGKLFDKVTGRNDFNCYAILLNYDDMSIPWPDGYKNPSERINGMAPIGLSNNQFFYAECGIVYKLDFGSCDHKEVKLNTSGEHFNKLMEKVAVENNNKTSLLPMSGLLSKSLTSLICAKHGNRMDNTMSVMEIITAFSELFKTMPGYSKFSVRILNDIDDTTVHFPQKFSLFLEDEPITLERFIDIINGTDD